MIRLGQIGGPAALLALLAGCNVTTTPADMRAQAKPPHQFQFAQPAASVKACLVAQLDKLQPFNVQPGLTRPPTIRDLGSKSEIFAQDETITLYVVDLEPAGARASVASAYATTRHVYDQIDAAARACGATVT